MVKSNEYPLIFTHEKPLEQQGESYEFLMNFMANILWLGERGFLVTIIRKWEYNVHVRWSRSWLEILISGKKTFFFTQTEYHLFTSVTLKVVWPLSEPWCVKTRGGSSTYSQRMQRISRWTAFACYHGHNIQKRIHL